MHRLDAHAHSFPMGEWPFQGAVETLAYTSAQVLEGQPILVAVHDHDGEWQFRTGQAGEDCTVTCLGCIYDRDRSIAILADLPPGSVAFREAVGGVWESQSYEDEDENEDEDEEYAEDEEDEGDRA